MDVNVPSKRGMDKYILLAHMHALFLNVILLLFSAAEFRLCIFFFHADTWDDLCWPLGWWPASGLVYYLENATQPWKSPRLTPAGRQTSSSRTPRRLKILRQGGLDRVDPLRDAPKKCTWMSAAARREPCAPGQAYTL